MEQVVNERPFFEGPHIKQQQTSTDGTLGVFGGEFQDLSHGWYPKRQTGLSRTPIPTSFLGSNHPLQVSRGNFTHQRYFVYQHREPGGHNGSSLTCRNFIQGKCTYGAACKFQHSRSHENSGFRSYGEEYLGKAGIPETCQFSSAEMNDGLMNDSLRNSSFVYQHREHGGHNGSRLTCRNFIQGKCTYGAACKFQHSKSHENSGFRSYGDEYLGNAGITETCQFSRAKTNDGLMNDGLRNRSFSRVCQNFSPRRNFQGVRSDNGESCPQVQTENIAYVRPRYVTGTHLQEFSTVPGNPRFEKRYVENITRGPKECYVANEGNYLRSMSCPRGPMSRTPCRYFLNGTCFRGASCPYLHATVFGRPFEDSGSQLDQQLAATSGKPDFVERTMNIIPRSNQHDKFMNHRVEQSLDTGINSSEDSKFALEQNRTGPMKGVLQPVFSQENQDISSRKALHSLDKMEVKCCYKFNLGRCDRGESCRYLHSFHTYARSIADGKEQPHFKSSTALRNSGVLHQSSPSMMHNVHDLVRNDNLQLSEQKHAESGPRDYSFEEKTERKYVNNSAGGTVHQKGETPVMDQHKSEISVRPAVGNGDVGEDDEDIDSLSWPLKRQRSRHNCLFIPRDEYGKSGAKLGKSLVGSSPIMIENKDSKAGAPSNTSCSREISKDSEPIETQGDDKVASHGMPLVQSPGSNLDSSISIVNQKSEAEIGKGGVVTMQDAGGLVIETCKISTSAGKNGINAEVIVSDSTVSCEKNNTSLVASVLNKDSDTEMNIGSNPGRNEKTEAVKAYSRTRKRSCSKHPVDATKKETTDPATLSASKSSTGEAYLSHPHNVSFSGASADLSTIDHPVQQHEQKNEELTGEIQNNNQPALPVLQDWPVHTDDPGCRSMQTSDSLSQASTSISKRKLLVLDLNGILVDITLNCSSSPKPDIIVSQKGVFKRPFCDDFLEFCFERFDVGVWSSRVRKNLDKIVDFVMGDSKKRLVFSWDQSHCTQTGFNTRENRQKPLVLKELGKLWEKSVKALPWERGYYNETNTVLLDDSPYKALRNPPNTAIFLHPYSCEMVADQLLGPDGDLRKHLIRLSEADNVQKFIEENPFGQVPITESNKDWGFYCRIAGPTGRALCGKNESNEGASPEKKGSTDSTLTKKNGSTDGMLLKKNESIDGASPMEHTSTNEALPEKNGSTDRVLPEKNGSTDRVLPKNNGSKNEVALDKGGPADRALSIKKKKETQKAK